MHAGLHALSWSLQRLAVALGMVVVAAVLAYIAWVFVIIAAQAVTALG